MRKIRKAIIPVAGLATRFLPATKAQPKTMMTLVDKPIIQYIVEEAVAAGIEQVIFVTGSNQNSIQDHFDSNFELEHVLQQRGKLKELEEVVRTTNMAKFVYTRQHSPRGDGHAILMAKDLVENEPVVVMYGDDIFDARVPVTAQLIETYEKYGEPVIALYDVGRENVSKYGIAGGRMRDDRVMEVEGYVEKPNIGEAPSSYAGVARYVVTPELMAVLARQKGGFDGEIRLADAFTEYLSEGLGKVAGRIVDARRYDCGDKTEFVKATLDFALKNGEVNRDGVLTEYVRHRASEL
ncbi:UTP--glucose-1-phosphate uridylyltransferase [Candidatus Uhrbacteria bacterium]|nr:UTP--glucose-1-phosphate uridylyltransferase [Candidatus Uhrbacteria bacterium]